MSAETWRIGHAIVLLRSLRGASRKDLGWAAGIHPRQVRRIEKGKAQPDLKVTYRLVKALGFDLEVVERIHELCEKLVANGMRRESRERLARDIQGVRE